MQRKYKLKVHKQIGAENIFKKSCLFICMLFLKYLREKSQRTKISGRKLLITSWAVFLWISFTRKKYLEQKLFITS